MDIDQYNSSATKCRKHCSGFLGHPVHVHISCHVVLLTRRLRP